MAVYQDPPLTTVRLPAHEIGFTAADHLIKMIEGSEAKPSVELLDTSIVVRSSCSSRSRE